MPRQKHRALSVVAVVLPLLLLAGCEAFESNHVEVACNQDAKGFSCTLQHTKGSKDVETCWDVVIQCTNGQKKRARACQVVTAGGSANKRIDDGDFGGLSDCHVHEISMENVEHKIQ